MKTILVSAAMLMLATMQPRSFVADKGHPYIKLLDGYTLTHGWAIDANAWTIERKDGLVINFESGYSEGAAADPDEVQSNAWFRTQNVNGYKVLFALIRPGVKTVFEPLDKRGLPPGNILLVSFLFSPKYPGHAANFIAKVANQRGARRRAFDGDDIRSVQRDVLI